jgi:hypothetical protein
MKKLFVRGLLFLPLLLGIIGVNITADPGNVCSRIERQVASDVLKGFNIANFPNLDDRQMQKHIIDGRTAAPDVVVFGSSRSMEIRVDCFPGRTFFNSGVGSSRIPDYVALYEAYRNRGLRPSLLVIGADPWILNARMGDQRWRSLQKDYDHIAERVGLTRDPARFRKRDVRKLVQLISPRYFQESLHSLARKDERPSPTTETQGSSWFLLADGSLVYPKSIRDRGVEEVRAVAKRMLHGREGLALSGFRQLDPSSMADFENFLGSVLADGAKVLLFIPPWHPVVYQAIAQSEEFQMVPASEAYFRALASKLGIPVVGSNDPAALGCGETDFRDGMHLCDRALKALLLRR